MKYLEEYRDPDLARRLAGEIHRVTTRPWTLMEVCGGQTHSIVRHGIDEVLPPDVTLIHGPGCPVCVTPVAIIDAAIAIARRPGAILCSFGDMLRVPGTDTDLLAARSEGADVRMVYSPLDAVALAARCPDREVVFFGVGFETTAPATALAVLQAADRRLSNFSMLVSHALVPPAMEALLSDPDASIQGFLAAGHVCAVMGYAGYEPIAARHRLPIVVTGFEPLDILEGILRCLTLLEAGRFGLENPYARVVRRPGNETAQAWMQRVFQVVDRAWRGMGIIPRSGLGLHPGYAAFDAALRFDLDPNPVEPESPCRSGEVLRGRLKPFDCPEFGTRCTPEHPLGATMVSSEGACAAYFRYRPRPAPAPSS
ncbi:MAG: hydrogenase formation protein HypD [Verrucomicrobiae bacterium]|nr:hydrogenase formation protein HypD [Verrucomicrobiae bacterium]